jgi:DNA-binding transcriptional ArsR family regulator
MGVTQSQKFNTRENKLADYARALAHPARIAILQFLIKQKTCFCGDIVKHLPFSQSTVSQHLKELKDVGLIKGEIEGVRTCYCINEKEWKTAQKQINNLFDNYTGYNDCC